MPQLYDLAGNPMTWDEAHERVRAWYEREWESKAAVRFVDANRLYFPRRRR